MREAAIRHGAELTPLEVEAVLPTSGVEHEPDELDLSDVIASKEALKKAEHLLALKILHEFVATLPEAKPQK